MDWLLCLLCENVELGPGSASVYIWVLDWQVCYLLYTCIARSLISRYVYMFWFSRCVYLHVYAVLDPGPTGVFLGVHDWLVCLFSCICCLKSWISSCVYFGPSFAGVIS